MPNVMPFYLVCDVSWAMRDEVATIREGIRRIRDQIRDEPILCDAAMVGIITFADTAEVAMPLATMGECQLPDIKCADHSSLTSYGAAFRMLAEVWEQDYLRLRDRGLRTYRPCAYFLTAGEPDDLDWQQTLDQTLGPGALPLRDAPGHPILAPFGFRDATEFTLRRLAYPQGKSRWYHANNASFESPLNGLLGIIMKSVLSTGNTRLAGQLDQIVLPPPEHPGISSGTAA